MAKNTVEKRRLIKFSNYSMCVTLPKWVIDQLEWKKGDQLTLQTDVKQGRITLYKEVADSAELEDDAKQTETKTEDSDPASASDVKPIPKLRW